MQIVRCSHYDVSCLKMNPHLEEVMQASSEFARSVSAGVPHGHNGYHHSVAIMYTVPC